MQDAEFTKIFFALRNTTVKGQALPISAERSTTQPACPLLPNGGRVCGTPFGASRPFRRGRLLQEAYELTPFNEQSVDTGQRPAH